MTDHIIKHGDDEMRSKMMETMRMTEQFRGIRSLMGSMTALAVSTGQKRRTVYDARQDTTLPGRLVRGEGSRPSGDIAVNEAYDGAGATYDLYNQVYQRNSVDDRGLRIDSTVHFDVQYDNAFWNGNQMVYGDGDGRLFNRFTIAIDVIGHELTHGVVQFEAGLQYRNESGALNESFADVFGSLVKQRTLNQTADQADWLIGAGLLAAGVNGQALRSLKAPGPPTMIPISAKIRNPPTMTTVIRDARTTAACISIRASRTRPFIWRRPLSAASPGKRPAESGISRSGTCCARARPSPAPPTRRSGLQGIFTDKTVSNKRRCGMPGGRLG
jgi:hypothetical protein